jgi:hypothetical protein
MLQCKTKKLFFDQYLYKVSLRSQLALWFRGNKIDTTISTLTNLLDTLKASSVDRIKVRPGYQYSNSVSASDLTDALAVAQAIKLLGSGICRVEGSILNFYCNDEATIDQIVNLNKSSIRGVFKPENDKVKEFLLTNPTTIFREKYTHKYKVTVNPLGNAAEDFKNWAANLPKIDQASRNYRYGGHFYVADLKTLSLCRLFLSNKIRRVDELCNSKEI